MSKKSLIDSVKVGTPCSEDWHKMEGTDTVRFCSHCTKHVNNLSEMTRKEAMRLVRSSDGNLCIRYIPNPVTQRPMFAEQLLQITRRAPGIAAGVMSASIALSTQAYAQDESSVAKPDVVAEQKAGTSAPDEKSTAKTDGKRLSGTVVDPNGAVVTGAKVTIYGVGSGMTRSTTTDENGQYKVDDAPAGTYRVEFESPGFAKLSREITLGQTSEAQADASLEIGQIELTVNVELPASERMEVAMAGVVAMADYSTPLARAVSNDDIAAARDLIIKGAKVNGKDENYNKITPLFLAVENGNIEMVTMLLTYGAKINARDRGRQTPLMRLDEDATPELVELLLRHGAKVDLVDDEGNTAIMIAACQVKSEVLKALIDAGADLRLANKEGQTALMQAASNDNLDAVKLLIEAGSNVNAKTDEGQTAYDMTSSDEIKELLLTHGAIGKTGEDRAEDDGDIPPGS